MIKKELLEENKRLKNALKLSWDIERQTFQDNLEMSLHREQSTVIRTYLLDIEDLLESLFERLVEDYNCGKPFEQTEEDRLIIGNILDLLNESVG
jgi:hypothetical protein